MMRPQRKPSAMSQRKSRQSPADALADEFRQERAAALGRLGRGLEARLAVLARFDADQSHAGSSAERRQLRASLVAEASWALWLFVVQREACGLRDSARVMQDYRVPAEVRAQMGISRRRPEDRRRKAENV
jgi:hypothetical protein